MTPEQAAALRAPFPPESIGHLPKGGVQLDYVGHAATTDRLLQVDPDWTWEPPTKDELERLPSGDGMWIKLTVCGVTRYGWGDGKNIKEWISDAIRNAAMRFGVALDLWSKEDLRHDEVGSAPDRNTPQHAVEVPTPPRKPTHARDGATTGTTPAQAPPVQDPSGPDDDRLAANSSSAGEPISKNQLGNLRSRVSALVSAGVKVADARTGRGLPKLTENCTRDDLAGWAAFLDDLEQIKPVRA